MAAAPAPTPRPPKLPNVMKTILECLEKGILTYSTHALDRFKGRQVTQMEVKDILRFGRHEKQRDRFDEPYKRWSYSIIGTTRADGRLLRVVVAFPESKMLVVTVIDPNLKE